MLLVRRRITAVLFAATSILSCGGASTTTATATSTPTDTASNSSERVQPQKAPVKTASNSAAQARVKNVAVVETGVDMQSVEITPAEVRVITAELRKEAVRNLPRDKYNVMTSETVYAQSGSVLAECADENCVIALGSKIGADYIVRGIVSKFRAKFTLSVEIYDTEDGNLIASSETVRSENAEELLEAAIAAFAELFKTFLSGGDGASFIDSRDGKKYKTALIDGQTWMAENLNHRAPRGSWCYGDDNSYCDLYGRLYSWNTAKKVCPAGWHLPSRAEWGDLIKAVGGSSIAAKKLRSASGWEDNANGTDNYGFSALPGGKYLTSSGAWAVPAGKHGRWWTATATKWGHEAYYRGMIYYKYDLEEVRDDTGYAYSVRCIRDGAPVPRSLSARSSGGASFTDSRDRKKYKTAVIGAKTWMAENLNYSTPSDSWCYDVDNYSCDKHGRLYNWDMAMKVCPAGWHLPSRGEWDDLGRAAGGERDSVWGGCINWNGAGKMLKSAKGWEDSDNGTDAYGFSAMPSGFRNLDGDFRDAGGSCAWWAAAEKDGESAYSRDVYGNDKKKEGLSESYRMKAFGFSVRCVQDAIK